MAKSLRSKPRLKAKAVKRKEVYTKEADNRIQRLHEKLQRQLEQQKEQRAEQEQENKKDESMELDEPNKNTKISTSGWRDSRKQRYRRRKAAKSKTLKF